MKAPFPYFGGKSQVAVEVWLALGQPDHYLEPFFGSGAVLLARPDWTPDMTETVCDKDGFIANAWRGIQFAPEEVAKWCDWPVNHCCLNARRRRLNEAAGLAAKLSADDMFFDAKLAGYWIWAASCWIGSGLTRPGAMPHLAGKGKGVHAIGQMPHLADKGKGIHAIGQRPHLADKGKGVRQTTMGIYAWFAQLSHRLRRVRVVCGDWTRICGGDWQTHHWLNAGIFFDPPYSVADRDSQIYSEESLTVAQDVATWCLARGQRGDHRIVLAGYADEHPRLVEAGWTMIAWKTGGGYGNTAGKKVTRGQENRHREMLYCSPHCHRESTLFA